MVLQSGHHHVNEWTAIHKLKCFVSCLKSFINKKNKLNAKKLRRQVFSAPLVLKKTQRHITYSRRNHGASSPCTALGHGINSRFLARPFSTRPPQAAGLLPAGPHVPGRGRDDCTENSGTGPGGLDAQCSVWPCGQRPEKCTTRHSWPLSYACPPYTFCGFLRPWPWNGEPDGSHPRTWPGAPIPPVGNSSIRDNNCSRAWPAHSTMQPYFCKANCIGSPFGDDNEPRKKWSYFVTLRGNGCFFDSNAGKPWQALDIFYVLPVWFY